MPLLDCQNKLRYLGVGITVAGPDAALDDGAEHTEPVFTVK